VKQRKKEKNIFEEIDKRNGRTHTVVSKSWPDGQRFRTRCPNLVTARQLLARINASIAEGRWEDFRFELKPPKERHPEQQQPVASPVTFGRLVSEFKKYVVANSLSDWGNIQGYLADSMLNFFEPDTPLIDIPQRWIEEYKAWRKNEDDARACTINKDLAVLRSLFQKAVDWKYLTENPAAEVKNYPDDSTIHDRYLRPEEYERLLVAAYDSVSGCGTNRVGCPFWIYLSLSFSPYRMVLGSQKC
jgi:hypothetical protein